MNDDVVIRIDGLWKRYGLPVPAVLRKGIDWLHAIGNPWLRPGLQARQTVPRTSRQGGPQSTSCNLDDGPWALRDINLEVKRGETLGIIGRNGAGKSTLLKVLAGVVPPTRGRVEVHGRIFPMIELNAGLHMELTGRENVRLLGAIMGFTRKEIEEKLPKIEAFCELRPWLDRPVRMYSSGMLTRLGFSVAVNVEADLLLIDEVLAVGDLSFQRKCYRRMEQLRRSGVTTAFVSHATRQVERLCSEVILLDEGEIMERGDPAQVCHSYMQTVTESPLKKPKRWPGGSIPEATWQGSGEVRVTKVETLNGAGEPQETFVTFEPLRLAVEFQATRVIRDPIIGIGIYTADMLLLAAFSDEKASVGLAMDGKGHFECEISNAPMLPGVYSIGVTVKGRDNSQIYKGLHLARFNIQHSARAKQSRGFIHIEPRWHFTPE